MTAIPGKTIPFVGFTEDRRIGFKSDMEASLRRVDALLMASATLVTSLPVSPADGTVVVISRSATGGLIPYRDHIARYSSALASWEYMAPAEGWVVSLDKVSSRYNPSLGWVVSDQVLDRGADPTGINDSSGIINALIAMYDYVRIPQGIFNIASPLVLRAGVTIAGAGPRATILKTAGTNLIFSADGGYVGSGGHTMNDITISGMRVQGDAGSQDGALFRGASTLRLDAVKFTGFGGRQVILDECWDSWFREVYWLDHLSTNKAALEILYGNGDNSNNLRWYGCGFEGIKYRSVYIKNGNSSTEVNYAFTFDDCKFEAGTVGAASSSPQFYIDGVGGYQLLRLTFRGGLIFHESNTQPWLYVGNGVAPRQISMKDVGFAYRGSLTTAQPILSLRDTKEVALVDMRGYGPGLPSPYVMADLSRGGNDMYYASRVTYNGNMIDPFNGTRPTNPSISTGPFRDIGDRRQDGNLDVYGTVSGRADTTGTPEIGAVRTVGGNLGVPASGSIKFKINSGNGNGEIWVRTQSGSETLAIDFVGGFVRFGVAWNDTRRFALGSYQFWVDASGNLRIKNGSPSSDTDGTIVGAQA